MDCRNGAGVAPALADNDAREIAVLAGEPDTPSSELSKHPKQVYLLHRGSRRHSRELVRVVPCDALASLFQVEWPDQGLSPPANRTRCMAAAREWAERQAMTEHRKKSVARRLKSLDNFWWSSLPVEKNAVSSVGDRLDQSLTGEVAL
jgi:hypothetical protein